MLDISTIFKTFDTSSTNIKDKTGIFNKSYTNIGRNLSFGQGLGTALFSGSHVTKADIANIQAMDVAMKNGSTTAQAWRKHMKGCTVAAKQQAKQCLLNKGSLSELTAGLQLTTLGLKGLSIAGNMLSSVLASMVVSAVLNGLDYITHAAERITEKATEAKSAIDEIKSSFDNLKTTTDDVKERYAELAQEVENFGKVSQSQGTLTTDEYQEFLSLSNQLAELFPQLTKNYDDNGNAILDLSGDVNTIVGSLNDLVNAERELSKTKILENMPNVWKGHIMDVLGEGSIWVNEEIHGYDALLDDANKKKESALAALEHLKESSQFSYENNGVFETAIISEALGRMDLDYLNHFSYNLSAEGSTTNWDFSTLAEQQIDQLKSTIGTIANEYEREVQSAQGKISQANAQMSSYINTWLSTEWNFSQLTPDLQNVVKDVLSNSDWLNMLPDEIDSSNWDAVSNWLQQNFLYAINNIKDSEIKTELADVFECDFTVESIENLINQISQMEGFDENNPLLIYLQTKMKNAKAVQNNIDNVIADTQKKFSKNADALSDEYKKIDEMGLGEYSSKIKDGTLQSVFGNVDMDKRTIINWTDELKETYKEALASWEYNPEVGSIDTVFGMSERFGKDLDGSGWEVAFTPILPDGTFLSRDTVSEYINSILSEAYANDGKVTEDELKEIDAQGKQIGNTFVKGIFAGMDASEDYGEDGNGNKASLFGKLMHFAGDFGAIKLAQGDTDWNKYFKDQSINTQEELDKWNEVTEGCHTATEAMKAWENAAKAAAKATDITLKSVSDAKKGLDSLFDSYEKDMELTADEVSEILQENPQYIQYLTKVGDTYKVNQKALEDWNKVQEEQERLIDIQMGSNAYATQYNSTLDGVYDISSSEYTGVGDWDGGQQKLDELIAKNKELNQLFADGKITAVDYFTSLSNSITNSGLDEALDDINNKFDETTDYMEATISVLSSELSDALIQANKRYTSGKTSVGDYADELMSSIEVQKKLLKSTYDLEDANDGYVKAAEGADEANKKAADSFNDIVDASKELDAVDEFADKMESYNDRIMQYVEDDGVTLTDGILGDVDLLNEHMDAVTDELVAFAGANDEAMKTVVDQVMTSLNVSEAAARDLINRGGEEIQNAAGQNMDAINGLTQSAMENTQNAVSSASQAIGNVLSALGDAIANFDYTINITPEGSIDMGNIIDMVTGKIEPKGEVKLHFSGSGGTSVQNFADSLKNAGNFFSQNNNNSAGTFKGYSPKTSGTSAAGKRPSSKTGSGGSGGSGGGDGDKAKDTQDKIDDIQEKLDDLAKSEALEAIKYKFDQIEQSVERIGTTISLLDSTLDMTAENDYIGKIAVTTQQVDLAQQKVAMLRNEFVQLKNTEYNSADAAEELASRMKSVADGIAESTQDITKYNRQITEYYMSALTSMSSLSKDVVDETSNLLDRNIESLSKGGLTGLDFSLSPTVPQSAYEIQREENETIEQEMQEHYNAVAEMQKIALDLKYQEQVEANAKEREELLRSLNEARAELQNFSNDVRNLQGATNTATSLSQRQDDAQKETETQMFANTEMSILSSLSTWMRQNPITAPGLDKTSWNKMVTDAEGYTKKVEAAWTSASSVTGSSNWSSGVTNRTSQALTGNSTGSKIVSEAKKYLGVPYVWGGSTPAGFDCSGLVQYVFAKNGKSIPRTSQEQFKAGTAVSKNSLQAGDVVFFKGSRGSMSSPGHVGIYIGNGQYIQAPQTGSVVKISDLDARSDFAGARRYATGTKDYGIAGENYKKEYAINKKTGQWSVIDTPTLFDKKEYDIVGEKVSEKIDEPIDTFAKGTISVPSGLGKLTTYMEWSTVTDKTSKQYKLKRDTGENYSDGYAVINNRKVLAMTDTFGNVGDYVDVYLTDGRVIQGVIGDIKDQTWAHGTPANKWGHMDGRNVVEYVVQKGWSKGNPSLNGAGVDHVVNLGNYFDDPNFTGDSSNSSDVTTEGSVEIPEIVVKPDFKTQLRELNENAIDSEQLSTYQDNLLDYIKENAEFQEQDIEKVLGSWENLRNYNDEQKKVFEKYKEELLKAVNTDSFESLRDEITSESKDYLKALIGAQTEVSIDNIKDSFARSKNIQDTILEYYYERRDAGADATELQAIIDAYSEQGEIVQDLSDSYVSILESQTDYLVELSEREIQQYKDRISWQSKIGEELERELEKVQDTSKAFELTKQMIGLNEYSIKSYREMQEAAHKNVVALKNDETYKDILKLFDIETWFDAEGELTAQFENDLAALNITDSETVPLMQQLAQQVQVFKKGWYEAAEAIDACGDNIAELNEKNTDTLIDTYIKLNEEVQKVLESRSNKLQLEYDAKSQLYEFQQTLRENKLEAQLEVKANKYLEEWLDPETRKKLFNDDNLSAYTRDINKLNTQIKRSYDEYVERIQSLKPEEQYMEAEITAEWERQLAIKQEQLEALKDEMNVAKKTLEYNNAAKEKDTQIILGNRVVNVADPEKLHNLTKEREELLNESELHKLTQRNNSDLRGLESLNNSVQTQINAIQQRNDMISDMSSEDRKAWAKSLPSLDAMNTWLAPITGVAVRWLNETITDFAGVITSADRSDIGNKYSAGIDYSELIEYIPDLVANNLLTVEQGKILSNNLLDYSRKEKTATSKDHQQWFDNSHAAEYGVPYDNSDYVKLPHSIEEIDETMRGILSYAEDNEGTLTDYDLSRLAKLETTRNRLIYNNGLANEQSSDYQAYGSQTFSDWVEGDYSSSIENMEKHVGSLGRWFTETELKLLKEWETARNKKIFENDLVYDQTSKYGGEIFKKAGVVDADQLSSLFDGETINSILKQVEEGKLIPLGLDFDRDGLLKNLSEYFVGNVSSFTLNDAMKYAAPNNITPQNANTFNFGDIIITEPVANGDEMVREFMDKLQTQVDLTKNMSH